MYGAVLGKILANTKKYVDFSNKFIILQKINDSDDDSDYSYFLLIIA